MNDQDGSGEGKSYYPQPNDTEELASKMVYIQNKRFYLDVKQNRRGRFIKIAEVTQAGNKNRLTLSMPIAHEFRAILGDFIEHYATLGPTNADDPPDSRRHSLKSDRISRDNKRYFLDLKENDRGRFLRVRQQQAFSNFNHEGVRTYNPPQIALPAQGMVEFRDALAGLIDEYGNDVVDQVELPESRVIGNKRSKQFFLDVGSNQRGVFLRITEQVRAYRSTINIPEKYWMEFANMFKEKAEEMQSYNSQILERSKASVEAASDVAEIGDGINNLKVETDERRRTTDLDEDVQAAMEKENGEVAPNSTPEAAAADTKSPVAT